MPFGEYWDRGVWLVELDRAARTDIQSYVDYVRARLKEMELSLEVDGDMRAFREFYLAQKNRLNFPTSLDESHTQVLRNAYWLKVQTASGRIVCCYGQKLFMTDDFIRSALLHTCYHDYTPNLDWYEVELHPEAERLRIGGRIVMGGGLWIDPEWRGTGHSLMIANRVARAIGLRHFEPDWFVSFMDYRASRMDMAKSLNGAAFAHAVRFSDGIYPPSVYFGHEPKDRPMILAWSRYDEALEIIRHELAGDADRHKRSEQRHRARSV